MTRRQRRLAFIGSALGVLALALGLVLYAMRDSIVFFRAPSEIAAKGVQPGTRFRLGGLVKEGSIQRGQGQIVTFEVTDAQASVPVTLSGPPAGSLPRRAGRCGRRRAGRVRRVPSRHGARQARRNLHAPRDRGRLEKAGPLARRAESPGEAMRGSSQISSPRVRGEADGGSRPGEGASQDEALPGKSPHPRCACFRLDKGPEALSPPGGEVEVRSC